MTDEYDKMQSKFTVCTDCHWNHWQYPVIPVAVTEWKWATGRTVHYSRSPSHTERDKLLDQESKLDSKKHMIIDIYTNSNSISEYLSPNCPTTLKFSNRITVYSRTCLGRPPLLPTKSGRSRQVVSHNRSDTNHVLPMCTFLHTARQ